MFSHFPFYLNRFLRLFQVIPEHDKKLVGKFGKVFGYYDGMNPNLWITDTSLIKQIFVKDFDNFVNRRVNIRDSQLRILVLIVELLRILRLEARLSAKWLV